MARILGIDYGEKRIGLAVSDPSGIVATPHRVLHVTSGTAVLREIAQCAEACRAERIVVGLPLKMDGSRGPAAEKVASFAASLEKVVSVPIVLWDERFTTVTAEQALIEGGTRRGKRKQVVDKLAAQILLQHYLDTQAGLPPIPSFRDDA